MSRKEDSLAAGFLDASAAQKYKRAEVATLPYAKIMVEKSGIAKHVKKGASAHVLDFACGTGAVVQELYNSVPKEKWGNLKVRGTDMSPAMLEYLEARGKSEGWTGLETGVVDGNGIEDFDTCTDSDVFSAQDDITQMLPKSTFTHIFVSFAIIVLPPHTLQRLQTLLQPGGYIAVTSWASVPWYSLFARSVSLMSLPQPYCPSSQEVQDKFCGNWGLESYMVQQLEEAGLQDVDSLEEKRGICCGTPDVWTTSMQFPLGVAVKTWWEQGKRDAQLGELNGVMKKVATENLAENGEVEMEFDGVVGWGWKSG
ncbi:coq5 family [Stemphylium lycopersici]|nr:coq5 family [Stemphylium lycopersici]